jgi:hypothetical protein
MTFQHANLLLRFLLELCALGGMGALGFQLARGTLRYALALLVPVLAAALWGIFAVPGDPSRSGSAPVAVPGWLRLALEAAFFSLGAYGYVVSGARSIAIALACATVLHYAFSIERLRWLLQR